jgi:hypothetical protein
MYLFLCKHKFRLLYEYPGSSDIPSCTSELSPSACEKVLKVVSHEHLHHTKHTVTQNKLLSTYQKKTGPLKGGP